MYRFAATVALSVLLVCCAPTAVRTDRVRIFDDPAKPEKDWGYDPPQIEVRAGATVSFTNTGKVFHTITDDGARVIFPPPTTPAASPAGRAFDAGADPGQTVTIRFDKPGTWSYHCGIHPEMKGVVIVCDGPCT